MNKLFYGDCLEIMRQGYLSKNSVDLIYLDPPFNSKKNYNLMYRTMTGQPVPEQVEAFCDTWELDAEKEEVARTMPVLMREHGVEDYYIQFWRLWISALRTTQPHLLAYLIYMVQRLLYMKSILRPTGSLFLHCDPTASHYIKVMLDGIFGHANFRNEIIWKRTSAHKAKRFAPVHDVIFFYTKSDKYTWNRSFQPLTTETLGNWYNNVDRKSGRAFSRVDLTANGIRAGASGEPWRGINPTDKGRHWAIPRDVSDVVEGLETQAALDALDKDGRIHWPAKPGGMPRLKLYVEESKGVPITDVITDIRPIMNSSDDRLGYPTQKPIELLDRIILAASNKGDIVFDPFCGCGTTIYSAHKNERRWVGCDVAILAIKLVKHTLEERYRLAERTDFEIDGIPMTVEQAQDLFRRDPFQFQHWAVEAVGGFPSTRKTGDGGIDGRLYFETKDGLKDMVISVKGGGLRPTDVRDLIGTLETEEGAELALFISLNDPSKKMREAAAKVAPYEYAGTKYEAVQFLTIADILEHKRTPHTPSKVGVKRATGQVNLPLVQKVQGEMVAE